MPISDRLLSLRVGDVMTKGVIEVSAHGSMGDAARLLTRHHISALPVVDEQGRCVGILSIADFVKREYAREEADESLTSDTHRLEMGGAGEPIRIVQAMDDQVESHMTQAVQTVGVATPLVAAARIMCAQDVHHLIVLGEHERPTGIISSLDITAALVNAVDERTHP